MYLARNQGHDTLSGKYIPGDLYLYMKKPKRANSFKGSNLGKNGKIYATTSSCLSGNEDYIGITIKKESVVYKKYINILSEKYVDEACAYNKHRYVFYKIPKTDFEKEYIK